MAPEKLQYELQYAMVCSHNVTRVKAIGQPIAPIRAKNNRKEAAGERGEKETNLQSKGRHLPFFPHFHATSLSNMSPECPPFK